MKKVVSATRLYRIWEGMRSRCKDEKRKEYKNYGGRGILVCIDWGVYAAFEKWALANGYSDKLELDRIDNDGNYCPENCRFVTHAQNNRNKRMRIDNKVGSIGICRANKNGSYGYDIQKDGKRYRKYGFATKEAAIEARNIVKQQIKY